jgi:hypothetical protein
MTFPSLLTSFKYEENALAAAAAINEELGEISGQKLSSSPFSAKIPLQPEAERIIPKAASILLFMGV